MDVRESTLAVHACFFIKSLSQRDEHIREVSVKLLSQLRDRFPQVRYFDKIRTLQLNVFFSLLYVYKYEIICLQILWNSSCLDFLLFSVHNDPPSGIVSDPAWITSVRSLYQKIVREWIIISLSHAPCTSQGLLQVCVPSLGNIGLTFFFCFYATQMIAFFKRTEIEKEKLKWIILWFWICILKLIICILRLQFTIIIFLMFGLIESVSDYLAYPLQDFNYHFTRRFI